MSELKLEVAVKSWLGRGSGGGNENSLEFLRRFAVGDNLLEAIHDRLAEDLGRNFLRSRLRFIRKPCFLSSSTGRYHDIKVLAFSVARSTISGLVDNRRLRQDRPLATG